MCGMYVRKTCLVVLEYNLVIRTCDLTTISWRIKGDISYHPVGKSYYPVGVLAAETWQSSLVTGCK